MDLLFREKEAKSFLIGGFYSNPRKLFQRVGTNDFSMISKNLICYIVSGIIAFVCSIAVLENQFVLMPLSVTYGDSVSLRLGHARGKTTHRVVF